LAPEAIEDILLKGLDAEQEHWVRVKAVTAITRYASNGLGSAGFIDSLGKYIKDSDAWVARSINNVMSKLYGLTYSEETGTFVINTAAIKKDLKIDAIKKQPLPKKGLLKPINENKVIEDNTVRLFKSSIRQGNTVKLLKFYNKSNNHDRFVIIHKLTEQILENSTRVNAELFEMFFLNILNQTPNAVIQNMQRNLMQSTRVKGSRELTKPILIMNTSVYRSLTRYNSQLQFDEKFDVNAVSLEISRVIVNLAVSRQLHRRDIFVKTVTANRILSRYINDVQAGDLYRIIINRLPNASYLPEGTVEQLITEQLRKFANKDTAEAADDIASLLTAHLSALPEIVQQDKRFVSSLVEFAPQLKKLSLTSEQLDKFFADISEELINGLAFNLAFRDSFIIAQQQIKTLNLDIDAKETAALLVPVMLRAALLDNAREYDAVSDNVIYQKFYAALSVATEGLRMASLTALEEFSQDGRGTARLISYLESYLAEEGTGISIVGEKIKKIIKNLSEPKEKKRPSKLNVTGYKKDRQPRPVAIIFGVPIMRNDLPLQKNDSVGFDMLQLIGSSI